MHISTLHQAGSKVGKAIKRAFVGIKQPKPKPNNPDGHATQLTRPSSSFDKKQEVQLPFDNPDGHATKLTKAPDGFFNQVKEQGYKPQEPRSEAEAKEYISQKAEAKIKPSTIKPPSLPTISEE